MADQAVSRAHQPDPAGSNSARVPSGRGVGSGNTDPPSSCAVPRTEKPWQSRTPWVPARQKSPKSAPDPVQPGRIPGHCQSSGSCDQPDAHLAVPVGSGAPDGLVSTGGLFAGGRAGTLTLGGTGPFGRLAAACPGGRILFGGRGELKSGQRTAERVNAPIRASARGQRGPEGCRGSKAAVRLHHLVACKTAHEGDYEGDSRERESQIRAEARARRGS